MMHRVKVHAEGEVLVDAADSWAAMDVAAQVFERGEVPWTRVLWEIDDHLVKLQPTDRYWVDDEDDDESDDGDADKSE
jgi:hypothetical protein